MKCITIFLIAASILVFSSSVYCGHFFKYKTQITYSSTQDTTYSEKIIWLDNQKAYLHEHNTSYIINGDTLYIIDHAKKEYSAYYLEYLNTDELFKFKINGSCMTVWYEVDLLNYKLFEKDSITINDYNEIKVSDTLDIGNQPHVFYSQTKSILDLEAFELEKTVISRKDTIAQIGEWNCTLYQSNLSYKKKNHNSYSKDWITNDINVDYTPIRIIGIATRAFIWPENVQHESIYPIMTKGVDIKSEGTLELYNLSIRFVCHLIEHKIKPAPDSIFTIPMEYKHNTLHYGSGK